MVVFCYCSKVHLCETFLSAEMFEDEDGSSSCTDPNESLDLTMTLVAVKTLTVNAGERAR